MLISAKLTATMEAASINVKLRIAQLYVQGMTATNPNRALTYASIHPASALVESLLVIKCVLPEHQGVTSCATRQAVFATRAVSLMVTVTL